MIKSMPKAERPRERLLTKGADQLSAAELLAILLCNGTQGKPVLHLAEELIAHFHGVEGLLDCSVAELMQIKGIGSAKAIQLKAAFTLAWRCRENTKTFLPKVSAPEEVYRHVMHHFDFQKTEKLLIALRDVRGRIYHQEIVGEGTLTEVIVHPREVFYHAIRHKAHSFFLAHNHPSGDPEPSNSDIRLTNFIQNAAKVMDVRFDDHLIIGKESYVSLWDRGLFSRKEY